MGMDIQRGTETMERARVLVVEDVRVVSLEIKPFREKEMVPTMGMTLCRSTEWKRS